METKDKGQVVYYYNRESRLEKASDNARFTVDHYGAKRPGLIRSLTATRSLRYLFFAVLFMAVAGLVVSYAQRSRSSGSVAGTTLSATAMWFEGYVYVSVKRSAPWYARAAKAAPGSVIEIKTGDGIGSTLGLLQSGEQELRLRFAAESKPPRVAVVASAVAAAEAGGDAQAVLEVKVE
ncbi:MAG: hypothetical protein KKA67_09645 [Spirochaetes bacterium]|nr:hypothetical protein [Spirochaetota bacterium]MBU1080735.1 hypothetical protein [Spirochaetota bacterium]